MAARPGGSCGGDEQCLAELARACGGQRALYVSVYPFRPQMVFVGKLVRSDGLLERSVSNLEVSRPKGRLRPEMIRPGIEKVLTEGLRVETLDLEPLVAPPLARRWTHRARRAGRAPSGGPPGGRRAGCLARRFRAADRGVRVCGRRGRGAGGGNGAPLRGEERPGCIPEDARPVRAAPSDARGSGGAGLAAEQVDAGDHRVGRGCGAGRDRSDALGAGWEQAGDLRTWSFDPARVEARW